ncbi:50S ribosomal protein L15 [Candidatus Adlerbacteria bacterium RIFCSPHIGHO2_02_FULL_52_17]|uniref:Large ribosomal subunit protein uL15 n=1 Tax=Candidatus Adlerbacteria bacterium RIFCSPHIGHO2_02_FULL_52_17 TaxID=1797240 RepID=A0A1F4XQM2_9BACT|nr:MAG: 50S ribosomal protein L15 [Candidatus Adlerbacteria bacterium RIFCSPHIGHO2_02_FULL_52_17]
MQLNTLQRVSARTYEKRVGRGGKRGKTSGRGTKGQKARAGHRIMPAIREVLKKLPKRRGYRFKSIQDKPNVVNVAVLERYFSAGDTIDMAVLAERGLVRSNARTVKVLGDGALTKKLSISGCSVSAAARAKIEQAGGSVQ